jgi:hypothetical protein
VPPKVLEGAGSSEGVGWLRSCSQFTVEGAAEAGKDFLSDVAGSSV